jgi:HPt (histidine-containing phosphotransfer) domain-containing protein
MNKADRSPEAASVNLSELLARVDNDRELLCDLLAIFKREFPDHLQALRNAVAGNDAVQVAAISHTLKGMLANLAVTKAADFASRLERLACAREIASLGDVLATLPPASGLGPRRRNSQSYLHSAGSDRCRPVDNHYVLGRASEL